MFLASCSGLLYSIPVQTRHTCTQNTRLTKLNHNEVTMWYYRMNISHSHPDRNIGRHLSGRNIDGSTFSICCPICLDNRNSLVSVMNLVLPPGYVSFVLTRNLRVLYVRRRVLVLVAIDSLLVQYRRLSVV